MLNLGRKDRMALSGRWDILSRKSNKSQKWHYVRRFLNVVRKVKPDL